MALQSDSLIGLIGRVSGQVGPGTTGEVRIVVRGQLRSYNAHPANGSDVIEVGSQVIIIDYAPPINVYVSPYSLGTVLSSCP